MYFEIEPKSKKEDFFNYALEYEQLKKALQRKEKIMAVFGVRRVGKTSLLNIIYNETKGPKIWLDGRIVSDPKKEIFAAIYETARSGKPMIFGKIESLNVSAFGVGLDIKVSSQSPSEMEKKIKSAGPICVFIDEAQRMNTSSLADVLSYCYDRFPQISFIVSGSEIGLLGGLLKNDDAKHPLYGRSIARIAMERLNKDRAFEFLRAGFRQAGVDISESELEEAIAELDGLIGWLTLFGYERGVKRSKDALEKTTKIATEIAASELLNFLKKTKNRKLYITIMRNAKGTTWNELRNIVGRELHTSLNPNLFNFALAKLTDHSFIAKRDGKYHLSDPLLFKAAFLV